jgi:hypothetical protein
MGNNSIKTEGTQNMGMCKLMIIKHRYLCWCLLEWMLAESCQAYHTVRGRRRLSEGRGNF